MLASDTHVENEKNFTKQNQPINMETPQQNYTTPKLLSHIPTINIFGPQKLNIQSLHQQANKQSFQPSTEVKKSTGFDDFLRPPKIIKPPTQHLSTVQLGKGIVLAQANIQNNQKLKNSTPFFIKVKPPQSMSQNVNQQLRLKIQKNFSQLNPNMMKNLVQQRPTDENQQNFTGVKTSSSASVKLTKSVQKIAVPSSDIIMSNDVDNSDTGLF